ncbi:nucleoside-diphosphate kinase [Actinoallomurus acanthiterrae]
MTQIENDSRGADVPASVDWTRWTVILLKPDCVRRGLVDAVLDHVGCHVRVSAVRRVNVTREQILAHYDDMLRPEVSLELGVDVPAELVRMFVGHQVVVALGYGTDAAARLRAVIGDTDPDVAGPDTIRGRFVIDTFAAARAKKRLLETVIHTSDNASLVERDFAIWFGSDNQHLLTAPEGQQ